MAKRRRGGSGSTSRVADTIVSGAGQTISRIVHDGIDKLREQAKSQAGQLGGLVRERGEAVLREKKEQVAQEIVAVSRAMRGAVDDDDAGVLSGYVDSAADGMAKLARFVERTDLSDVGRDVERFARRHPAAVLGGLFVFGLAAGRMVRVGLSESA